MEKINLKNIEIHAFTNVFQVLMSKVHRTTQWRRRRARAMRENLGIKYHTYFCFYLCFEFQLRL